MFYLIDLYPIEFVSEVPIEHSMFYPIEIAKKAQFDAEVTVKLLSKKLLKFREISGRICGLFD